MISVACPVEADVLRLRHEFVSMPGLRLTPQQTARLLGVRLEHAMELLAALEEEAFLMRAAGGSYRLVQPPAA
jgi:hypothetical protein